MALKTVVICFHQIAEGKIHLRAYDFCRDQRDNKYTAMNKKCTPILMIGVQIDEQISIQAGNQGG